MCSSDLCCIYTVKRGDIKEDDDISHIVFKPLMTVGETLMTLSGDV